jgi:hypothetical protein
MRNFIKLSALVLAVALAAACASQKAPAETALKAAETAWAAVSAEATKYVPDQAKSIDEAIKAVKDLMAKGDYAAVIKDAGVIPGKIADLQKTIQAKKDEWTAAWRTLDSALGSGLTAVQTKVDELANAKKLPKGVEKAAVEGAKTALAAAQQTFADAKSAFGEGNYEAALAKANQVKTELGKIMTDLKLEMPVAAEAGKTLTEAAEKTIKDTLKK